MLVDDPSAKVLPQPPKFLAIRYYGYRIVGNFHMVQNFTVFADRSATVKIKTTKISMGGEKDNIIVNHRTGKLAIAIEYSSQPC